MTNGMHLQQDLLEDDSASAAERPPRPIRVAASGRYLALPPNASEGTLPSPRARGTLNLDVDGTYPQHVASGTVTFGLRGRAHWIARVRLGRHGSYAGAVEYKEVVGTSFPYDSVEIRVSGASAERTAVVKFTIGGSSRPLLVPYRWTSPFFRRAEFEYDRVERIEPVVEIDPTAHPNHPSTLEPGRLSIQDLYRRAGVDARLSASSNAIPMGQAGPNATWSDAEMHDAMLAYWSRFANRPQWALWVLFANQHDSGTGLGGIMFDSIGPNHRQGTAVFYDSFISQPPAGDTSPAAWVERMRFWTAVHEMGHAFNLAHSWQKALGTPWLALQNEPEARSPMNYPYRVRGGERAFFADFAYRFSDPELLFLRHAPERFVEMGAADWFDHHAFEQAEDADPGLRLEIRTRPERKTYQFLEPVVIELKLTNASADPKLVPERALDPEGLTTVVKRRGAPARQVLPLTHRCFEPRTRALAPGESMYESLFVSVGSRGWMVDEPGDYRIQLAIHVDSGDLVSNPLALRVEPPTNREEERYAQDFFQEEVGRVLAFDGSLELVDANGVLVEAAERLKARAVATHAAVAVGLPSSRRSKRLVFEPGDPRAAANGEVKRIEVSEPNEKIVLGLAGRIATDAALTTLGNIDGAYYVERLADALEHLGMAERAYDVQAALVETMKERRVAARALQQMTVRRDALSAKQPKSGKGRTAG